MLLFFLPYTDLKVETQAFFSVGRSANPKILDLPQKNCSRNSSFSGGVEHVGLIAHEKESKRFGRGSKHSQDIRDKKSYSTFLELYKSALFPSHEFVFRVTLKFEIRDCRRFPGLALDFFRVREEFVDFKIGAFFAPSVIPSLQRLIWLLVRVLSACEIGPSAKRRRIEAPSAKEAPKPKSDTNYSLVVAKKLRSVTFRVLDPQNDDGRVMTTTE